ncbi:MAG: SDR family NAD(P)-dependent oxidoreductase [Firmicutes bacterium]|nr:SDR family NAD(P)-dependent oxidoreductase [Bacillota bacterium]
MIMDGNYKNLKDFANPDSVLDKAPKSVGLEEIGMSLKGKVAIVTGGGRGIGRAIALQLAKAGANVCVTSRTQEENERTAKECVAYGSEKAIGVAGDVRDRAQVKNVVDTCVKELGEPFILVCNAGVGGACPTLDLPESEWDRFIDTNMKGILNYVQEAGQYMVKREPIGRVRGKIIIVSSITGLRGGRGVGLLAYHASKGGAVLMTKALAQEWAKYDINVNGIAPGTFLTDLSTWTGSYEKEKKYLDGHVPMAVFKNDVVIPEETPELIGTLALYLASPAGDYTTSQVIAIDGGTVEHFI